MFYKELQEAKLMFIYFGVTFLGKKGNKLSENLDLELDYISYDYSDNKFSVHPDTYHIFEPQEGDKNIDGYVFDANLQAWKKFTVMTPLDDGVYNMKPPHELPISERNGKVFIAPERE